MRLWRNRVNLQKEDARLPPAAIVGAAACQGTLLEPVFKNKNEAVGLTYFLEFPVQPNRATSRRQDLFENLTTICIYDMIADEIADFASYLYVIEQGTVSGLTISAFINGCQSTF